MKKLAYIGQTILTLVFLVVIFLVSFLNKFNKESFNISLYLMMGYSMASVLFLLFLVVKRYEIKRLSGAIYGSILVLALVYHYVLSYLDFYQNHEAIYWLSLVGILVVAVPILVVINMKLKPQKLAYTKKDTKEEK